MGDNAVNRSITVSAVITIKKGGKNLDGRALQTAIIHGHYHWEKSRRHVGLIITILLLFLSAARAEDESCVAWFPDIRIKYIPFCFGFSVRLIAQHLPAGRFSTTNAAYSNPTAGFIHMHYYHTARVTPSHTR